MGKKRITTKIGDIFCAVIDNEFKCFFQYIANDMTQLNSSVIRVFKTHYPLNITPKICDIMNDEVDFYAHTILRIGIENHGWKKIGTFRDLSSIDFNGILFASAEYIIHRKINGVLTSMEVNPLENWYVWKINQSRIFIGELPNELLEKVEAESSVISYMEILDRIKYGYYRGGGCAYDIIKRIPRPHIHSFMRIETVDEFRYFHFYGENLIDYCILAKKHTLKLLETDSLKEMKFWDFNWGYGNFITKDEFLSIKNNFETISSHE